MMRRRVVLVPVVIAATLPALVSLLNGCGGGGGASISHRPPAEEPAPAPAPAPGPGAGLTALLPAAQQSAVAVGSERCATCHGGSSSQRVPHQQAAAAPAIDFAAFQQTKHFQNGYGCEDCHGPGSNHANSPSEDNILTFPNIMNTAVCAQCHEEKHDEWENSAHAEILEHAVEGAVTNPATYGKSSRCVVCHSGLFRTETVEQGVDISAMSDDEVSQIAQETLDNVPNTAGCATCHNPHQQTGNLSGDGEELQLRHPVSSLDTSAIDAGSPASEFTTFNHQCAECHNGRGVDPSDAKLKSSTSRPGMHDSNQYNMLLGIGGVEDGGPAGSRYTAHAEAKGQCSHCHVPQGRHTFTVSLDTSCSPCHTAADAAARAGTEKADMESRLLALRGRMESWAKLQDFNADGQPDNDPDLWDYTSLLQSEGKTAPDQSKVPIEVKRARHNYYFVVRDASTGIHNAPYARLLMTVANNNLDAIGVAAAQRTNLTRQQMRSILQGDAERASEADRSGEVDYDTGYDLHSKARASKAAPASGGGTKATASSPRGRAGRKPGGRLPGRLPARLRGR